MLFLTSDILKHLYSLLFLCLLFHSFAKFISLIVCFQVLHWDISFHLLFSDSWRKRNPGVQSQNHVQPILWRLWETMWTAHTLENCVLTLPPPLLKHKCQKQYYNWQISEKRSVWEFSMVSVLDGHCVWTLCLKGSGSAAQQCRLQKFNLYIFLFTSMVCESFMKGYCI